MPTDELPVLDVDLTRHDLYRNGFPYQRFAELRRRHSVWWHPRAYLSRRPDGIEFWYGAEFRLHERQRYDLRDGAWSKRMLYP